VCGSEDSGYRFPSEIISYAIWSYAIWSYAIWSYAIWSYAIWSYAIWSYAIWTYHRFCLSFRDVEDLLAERGVIVSVSRQLKLTMPQAAFGGGAAP